MEEQLRGRSPLGKQVEPLGKALVALSEGDVGHGWENSGGGTLHARHGRRPLESVAVDSGGDTLDYGFSSWHLRLSTLPQC